METTSLSRGCLREAHRVAREIYVAICKTIRVRRLSRLGYSIRAKEKSWVPFPTSPYLPLHHPRCSLQRDAERRRTRDQSLKEKGKGAEARGIRTTFDAYEK